MCTKSLQVAASFGHTVKLIHPRYVTPYRLGDKNDANDAVAICAAAQRPDMRTVGPAFGKPVFILGLTRPINRLGPKARITHSSKAIPPDAGYTCASNSSYSMKKDP